MLGHSRDEGLEIDEFFDGMSERNIEPDESTGRRATSVVASIVAFALIVLVVPVAFAVPVAFTVKAVADEGVSAYESVPAEVPEIPSLPGYTYVYDSQGNVIAQFYAENRQPVTYDEVAPVLVDAIVSVEDRRFWDHSGVDGESVARALLENFKAGETVQGASTLTQQLVENLKLLNAEDDEDVAAAKAQSMSGKLVEGKTAMLMEEQMTKEEILETYMNVVYFGSGSYGVGAAADRFFGVSVSELTIAQAALIAGMVREPSGLDPFLYPERAKNRRDTVLVAMKETGAITEREFDEAIASELDVSGGNRPPNGCDKSPYPFYCSIVREQLLNDYRLGRTQKQRDAAFYQGHLSVHTALDPDVMEAIDESISEAMDNDNRVATSAVVVEPGTGLVRGIGQNRDWGNGDGQTEIPYATSAFQPGSTFKPIILATALEQGISQNTKMSTGSGFKPSGFDYPDGGFDNYAFANYGTIDAYDAARLSSNVWFTKLITRTGVPEAVEMARNMGVRDSLDGLTISRRSASFALGAWEVQPVEMASVYATMAAAGSSCEPVFITDVVDNISGDSLTTQRTACETVYDEGTADALMDVIQEPFSKGGTAEDFPLSGHEAIGKTGTTNGHAAAWFAGATPQYATAVWVGDPRGGQAHPLYDVEAYGQVYPEVFGADISGPIWNGVMTRLHADLPEVKFSQVKQSPVSPQTLADLVKAPSVRGMGVYEATAALIDAGYTVALDSSTVSGTAANVVYSSSEEYGHITLVAGDGTDSLLLGQELIIEGDRVLVKEGGE